MNHVRRREFLLASGALLAVPIVAQTQGATKPYRIGLLQTEESQKALLQQSLRELGYVEGRDVVFEIRNTEGRSERLDDFALDLVRRKVDVIVAVNPAGVLSAKRATATIPIVMTNTPDPIQLGLVASLAKPGGNITGTTTLTIDLSIKQLDLLKEAVPRAARVALLSLLPPDSSFSRSRRIGTSRNGLNVSAGVPCARLRNRICGSLRHFQPGGRAGGHVY